MDSRTRAQAVLPDWAIGGSRASEPVDAVYSDVLWLLRRYRMRVSTASEAGDHPRGEGTAVDLVPTAVTIQRDVDTPGYGASGTRTAEPLRATTPGWRSARETRADGARRLDDVPPSALAVDRTADGDDARQAASSRLQRVGHRPGRTHGRFRAHQARRAPTV